MNNFGHFTCKILVYKIKKMEFKEEYVNEISRFSNRL